jgi:hypothetical protein
MAKCTDKELVNWFEKLYKEKATYIWGADCQIVTYDLMKKLLNNFKSKTYDENYYLVRKYNEGKGKIAADCSGAFTPMSGKNQTARAYYNETKNKGRIVEMPKHKVCLVWNKKLSHIGLYCGNGYTIEMKSSNDNCVKQQFKQSRWYYYGLPDWIEYTADDWVARLQKAIGAKVDNVAGKETLSKTPTIKQGSKGEVVKLIQERLEKEYNISVGKYGCDGSCGKDTVKAIKEFQKKYVGLKNPDGEITSGHITWKTLLGL